MRITRKKVVVGVTAVAVAGAAGGAFAYWSTTGSGAENAATTAGTVDQLTFTQTDLNETYPGDSSQVLTVAVKNASTESAYVAKVKAYLTVQPVAPGTCSADDFLLNNAEAPGTAGGAASLTWTAQDLASNAEATATSTIQFNNKTTKQDGCKNAQVTVHYLAS